MWWDEATGLPCVAQRNAHFGNWCGYVGVPHHHTWYEVPKERLPDLHVHGGLTFSDHVDWDSTLWWLGFDCCHGFDLTPYHWPMPEGMVDPLRQYGTYRTLAYVEAECARLAEQLDLAQQVQDSGIADRTTT